jgi:hypothetical protein
LVSTHFGEKVALGCASKSSRFGQLLLSAGSRWPSSHHQNATILIQIKSIEGILVPQK